MSLVIHPLFLSPSPLYMATLLLAIEVICGVILALLPLLLARLGFWQEILMLSSPQINVVVVLAALGSGAPSPSHSWILMGLLIWGSLGPDTLGDEAFPSPDWTAF